MTPDQYRHRWGLGADYPMVAPNYAKPFIAGQADRARHQEPLRSSVAAAGRVAHADWTAPTLIGYAHAELAAPALAGVACRGYGRRT